MDYQKHFAGILLLTDREYECFKALGHGLSTEQIAQINGRKVNRGTVNRLLERVRFKVGLQTYNELRCLAGSYNFSGLQRQAIVGPRYQFRKP